MARQIVPCLRIKWQRFKAIELEITKLFGFLERHRAHHTFRCISVVIFISKANNKAQILQTVHDVVILGQ